MESLAGARMGWFLPRIESASTSAYTMLGLLREKATVMRPFSVDGNPPPFTSVQLLPPSVLCQSPEPGPPT